MEATAAGFQWYQSGVTFLINNKIIEGGSWTRIYCYCKDVNSSREIEVIGAFEPLKGKHFF